MKSNNILRLKITKKQCSEFLENCIRFFNFFASLADPLKNLQFALNDPKLCCVAFCACKLKRIFPGLPGPAPLNSLQHLFRTAEDGRRTFAAQNLFWR